MNDEDAYSKISAWDDEKKQSELDYMLNTIRSSWEFIDYTFDVKDVTRGFTHQFVRTRQGSYAQQSQRTVDMQGFGYYTPDRIYKESHLDMKAIEHLNENKLPTISTIPMPALMKIVGWKDIPEFDSKKIWTQKGKLSKPDCNVYQTIYYPDPLTPYYRISIIGNIVISEFIIEPPEMIGPHIFNVLHEDFGIRATEINELEQSHQKYGKIKPINEALRKQFIYEMTTKYNIYSLGRFATWRQLLLDDVVEDCQHIEKFIDSNYNRLMQQLERK